MNTIEPLNACCIQQVSMQQLGCRRLLVLSGDLLWSKAQAKTLSRLLSGDWLWCTNDVIAKDNSLPFTAVKQLLGQEFKHAVFDATQGFDVEALAVLSGTLVAGSWLLLLVPSWRNWDQQKDRDTARWNDSGKIIATPHFVHRLKQLLRQDPEVVIWKQEALPPVIHPLKKRCKWHAQEGKPTTEQQEILQKLLEANTGVWVLTAARGRGKSALAGMLVKSWLGKGLCWLTAPQQAVTQILQQHAGDKLRYWAPDTLLAHCMQQGEIPADWLLVDEAAAIPGALLQQLIGYFPRVLLLTTVQGYEGTGQGFLLKLCARLPRWQPLSLIRPIRWAEEDPLERFLNQLCLFDEPDVIKIKQKKWDILPYQQADLVSSPHILQQFYLLLTSAHYRTRPRDLRRLMDAQGMFYQLGFNPQKEVIAGLWAVEEGGIVPLLARDVWAGWRRPRGNLVAQSLAAHAGEWTAPMLRSCRISRIAVQPVYRRLGIGKSMLTALAKRMQEQGKDYLAVSFGFDSELNDFWHNCGFVLVRIGEHKEASSGCYTAMALYPLSRQGSELVNKARQCFIRNFNWLQEEVKQQLPISLFYTDLTLTDRDWQELVGFACANRSFSSSCAALQRFLYHTSAELTTLRAHLQQQHSFKHIISTYYISGGKKALLQGWRQEVKGVLQTIQPLIYQRYWNWLHTQQVTALFSVA